ncbi:unnamed protein product [Parnassius apollo]|uniref:(apollo) hypothetical protein n=1 Tax=Parnassius apollo TaxID=110799 RepID=A0A8S3X722_PARAO|nr:unnamed protein product [Parnassius apollo]
MKKNKEWSNDDMFLLIDLYKEKPCLWDPTNNEYKLKAKRSDCWLEIANILNCDVSIVKKKMESLLNSFRRERQRCAGFDEIYCSTWFAFEKMKFLLDKFSPRPTQDTLVLISYKINDRNIEHYLAYLESGWLSEDDMKKSDEEEENVPESYDGNGLLNMLENVVIKDSRNAEISTISETRKYDTVATTDVATSCTAAAPSDAKEICKENRDVTTYGPLQQSPNSPAAEPFGAKASVSGICNENLDANTYGSLQQSPNSQVAEPFGSKASVSGICKENWDATTYGSLQQSPNLPAAEPFGAKASVSVKKTQMLLHTDIYYSLHANKHQYHLMLK